MSRLSILYTTFPNEEEAQRLAKKLLEKRLVACVNLIHELKSFYIWKGKLEENREIGALFKTTPEKMPSLMEALQELHPYETPAIIELSVPNAAQPFCRRVEEAVV